MYGVRQSNKSQCLRWMSGSVGPPEGKVLERRLSYSRRYGGGRVARTDGGKGEGDEDERRVEAEGEEMRV